MRVGLIIYGSIDTITGGYIYDKKLVEYLRAQGVEVKIFSQPGHTFWQRFKNNFSKRMLEQIAEFSPDILLQDGMNYLSLFLLNKKLTRLGNLPLIGVIHLVQSCIIANPLKKIFIQQIEKFFFSTLNGFIFNSMSTREAVIKLVAQARYSVIAYPGKDRLKVNINTDTLFATPSNKQFKVMFIGNLTYNKGLHVLLEALAQIKNQYWHLSVIGNFKVDLAYTQKITALVRELRISDQVRLLGVLTEQELSQQFPQHHVLAVPSYYESFGIIYAEAMGAGLPVIATNAGGTKEIITHATNGFLVEPGNVSMVKTAIEELILNRELLTEMSVHSRLAYSRLPSWEESMQTIYGYLARANSSSLHLKRVMLK